MSRWLKIGASVLLLAAICFFWMAHRESQMIREDVRETQAALGSVTSFHFRFEGSNFLAGEPPMTQDTWVVCPDFRYEITRVKGAAEREDIRYRGAAYTKFEGRWVKIPGSQPLSVQGCGTLAGDYGLGIPAGFPLMFSSGAIHVNNDPRMISGVPCYDYTVTIQTADTARRKLIQTLCLNSDDHLPRQVAFRMDSDPASLRTYTYDGWNQAAQPNLPDGFPAVGE